MRENGGKARHERPNDYPQGLREKKTESFIYYEYTVYFMLKLYFLEGKKRKPHDKQPSITEGRFNWNLVYEI